MIVRGKCWICSGYVDVINCHYQCQNCGFAANWDEGSDNQLDLFNKNVANNEGKELDYEELWAYFLNG